VVKKLSNLTLLMIIGPSGVGKSSLIDVLGIPYVISDTTRGIRPREQNGMDFYFRQDYAQIVSELKSGQFVQVAVDPSGDLKASKASYYPENGIVVMAIVSDVVPVMRKLGFQKTISAFITPPSYKEWMNRIKKHGLSEEEITKRLPEAVRSLNFALHDKDMHFILNDNLAKASFQIQELINDKTDQSRESESRNAAQEILSHLK
jgi:guanylate kinase